MNAVFADTGFWIALTSLQDMAHEKAVRFQVSLASRNILTSESVLTEYLNYFAAWGPLFRRKACRNVHAMLSNQTEVTVVPHTTEMFLAALELYGGRLDKGYSLTDCISMHFMRQAGLTDVLTSDRHFQQEGFRALFRD